MDNLSISPSELVAAANTLASRFQDYSDDPAGRFWLSPDEAGNAEVATALAEFQQASAALRGHLTADGTEITTRLAKTANSYQETDAETARALDG